MAALKSAAPNCVLNAHSHLAAIMNIILISGAKLKATRADILIMLWAVHLRPTRWLSGSAVAL